MAVTRINNNQITNASAGNVYLGVNAAAKLQNYSITSNKIANSLVYGSDLTVSGNLTVNGSTTTIDTVNTLIQDPILVLADGQISGSPTLDIGVLGYRGSQNSSFIGWKENATEFVAILSNTTISNTTVNITSYANFHANSLIANTTVTAVGNITGANILTAGLISSTGNLTAGNITTAGIANVSNVVASGVSTFNANVNINGNLSVAGNVTYINVQDLTVTDPLIFLAANNTANLLDIGYFGQWNNGTGNQYGGIIRDHTDGIFKLVANISSSEISNNDVDFTNAVYPTMWTGNIKNYGNISTTGNVATDGNTVTTGYQSVTGNLRIGTGNVFYVDTTANSASFGNSTQQSANALVSFNSTTAIVVPVGNTVQRPSGGTSKTGMIRFNTTNNGLELYDNTQWTSVGGSVFTVIADDQFNGDGLTVAFTLSTNQTTNSVIVSINGVLQVPTSAYSVSGTPSILTFTEAPAVGDLIDVRELTTTTTIISIANAPGNAIVAPNATTADINITGNVNPIANLTYTLGNTTNWWSSLYVGGNTIYLGNLQLKQGAGNTFTVTANGVSAPLDLANSQVTAANLYVGTANAATAIFNLCGNGVGNIGNSTTYFNTAFVKATSAQYADLAEKYVADADYAPGIVLAFGGEKEVTISKVDSDRAVAGVVSTNPSYIMNGALEAEYVATVAFTGRVPTSVTGKVVKGDLMVSNGDGTARADQDPKAGAIIGKALENFDGESGVIEVVVGRF